MTSQAYQARLIEFNNCEDFETWKEAQEVFESAGGIENDVHRLDRDGDAIPCEALK